MTFDSVNLLLSYDSDDPNKNPVRFYNAVLPHAIMYKRITGYFSSASFALIGNAIESFLRNDGKMQFIFNVYLNEDDYRNIRLGVDTPETIIESRFLDDLSHLPSECVTNHAKVLGWLIATKRMEIKIGYIEDDEAIDRGILPILHQKSGVLEDKEGNIIAFSGSNNESKQGFVYNTEFFNVFSSLSFGTDGYIRDILSNFETHWDNKGKRTRVIPFPDAVEKKLIEIAPRNEDELKDVIKDLYPRDDSKDDQDGDTCVEIDTNHEYTKPNLRDYQIEAINQWVANNYHGILEMATGTGKTITAISGYQQILTENQKLILIVTCPYAHLLSQWETSLKRMQIQNLKYMRADSTVSDWMGKTIQAAISGYAIGKIKPIVILTTNDTASSKKFRLMLDKIQEYCRDVKWMLISDEVHSLGSPTYRDALYDEYEYRLGLSATPERYFDDDGSQYLQKYFGNTVYKFSLSEAINTINPDTGTTYLVPYDYYVRFASLDEDEIDEYIEKSRQIAKLTGIINTTGGTKEDYDRLNLLRTLRKNILKNANNKTTVLAELVEELAEKNEMSHLLIYCSESNPKQLSDAKLILDRVSAKTHHLIAYQKYTSAESARISKQTGKSERDQILIDFDKGNLDVLLAMKCLDEGVDVPSTKTAILMCSSGNPKEYIQRRGRILRPFPGKTKAVLYDIGVLPPMINLNSGLDSINEIIESEKKRMHLFADDSLNHPNIEELIDEYYLQEATNKRMKDEFTN